MHRGEFGLILIVMLSALTLVNSASAQPAKNPQFIGDPGQTQGAQLKLLPGMAPTSYNSKKREEIRGVQNKLKDYEEVTLLDGSKTDLINARQFMEYLRGLPKNRKELDDFKAQGKITAAVYDQLLAEYKKYLDGRLARNEITQAEYDRLKDGYEPPVFRAPPDNKIVAVDILKWESLTDAERAASTIKRPVKRTRTYTVAKPIFQARTYITYPCCCEETFNIQIGVTYETKTEVIDETEVVGADFPIVEVNLPRDVFVAPDSNVDPFYRTQVPQYACSGSSVDQARPIVPLASDQRDGLVVSPGSTVTQDEGIAQTTQSDTQSVQLGSPLYDCGVFVGCTPDGSAFTAGGTTTTTYNGTTLVKEPVNAKVPLGPIDRPMDPGVIERPGEDKGLKTFDQDRAEVVGQTVLINATGDPTGDPAAAPIVQPR